MPRLAALLALLLALALLAVPVSAGPSPRVIELTPTQAGYVEGPLTPSSFIGNGSPYLPGGAASPGQNYIGLVEFAPPPSKGVLTGAGLALTGTYDALARDGTWRVSLLDAAVRLDETWTYDAVQKMGRLGTLTPTLTRADLGVGRVNHLTMDRATLILAQRLLMQRGFIVLAVSGPASDGPANLFMWGTGLGLTPSPVLTLTTLTPRW